MQFDTLYGKNADGSLKVWSVETDGAKITVTHGKLGGKQQSKTTICTEKNLGKANYLDATQQAEVEARAKWVKQQKKGYFTSQEDATGSIDWTPMKCQDFKKFAHKVNYPCYQQPKLNGLRCMIDANGEAWSKAGEPYKLPQHIQEEVLKLAEAGKIPDGIDGEIYAGLESEGGLSLQRIVSAFRKPNNDTPRLKLYVYDLPSSTKTFDERKFDLDTLDSDVRSLKLRNINVLRTIGVENEVQGDEVHSENVANGFEGSIYRNKDGIYDFGGRSYDVIKRKPRQDAEAKVVSVEIDKNGQGVLTCEEQTGVQFKCLMLKKADEDVNYRLYENALTLIGKFITFEFEERSDDGIATKPVGTAIREVNPDTWEPKF